MAQKPSAIAKSLLEIADTNFGLNFDENGDRRPEEYAAYCGIHNDDEKQYIHRTRKLPEGGCPKTYKFSAILTAMHPVEFVPKYFFTNFLNFGFVPKYMNYEKFICKSGILAALILLLLV